MDHLVNIENVFECDITSAQQWSYMVIDGKGKGEQNLKKGRQQRCTMICKKKKKNQLFDEVVNSTRENRSHGSSGKHGERAIISKLWSISIDG